MKVAIYARYSAGPRQTDQSIEGQLSVCEAYCSAHGHQVVAQYIDRHISGKTDSRPEFQRMILDSGKHIFEGVLVYKTDRFARNKYDSAIYKQELKRNGVKVLYAAEAIPDGPEGIILESLMEGLAEYYSAELAQKIRRGMRESAKKAHSTGSNKTLGYYVDKDKAFQIDPEQAESVRTIFNMYINKESKAAICEVLNARGARTAQGKLFNKSSIDRIISNEKYIGIYKYDDIVIEGGVPAIVSQDIFDQAQKEKELRKTRRNSPAARANYLLSGKLFCGHCGKAMIGISGTGKTGGKWYYYVCPSQRAKASCKKKRVSKEWLEEMVVQQTTSFFNTDDRIAELADKLVAYQESIDNRKDQLSYYKKRLADIQKSIDNIVHAIETQGETAEPLLVRMSGLMQERDAMTEQINILTHKPPELTREEIIVLLHEHLTERDDDPDAFRERIIGGFVSQVVLFDDKLLIHYNLKDESELSASELSLRAESSTEYRTGGPVASLVEPLCVFMPHGFLLVCRFCRDHTAM